MNYRMIINIIAKLLAVEGLFMLPALAIALVKGENSSAMAFAAVIILMLAISLPFALRKGGDRNFFAREGLLTVGIGWILVSAFGALPFCISGAIPNYIDCFFETVSGFTTTGATILEDIESLPMSMLYWRSFTHWLGGMGVLVFMMILSPLTGKDGGENMHLLRAESPGIKISKLVPRMKRSASILYAIYIFLTLLQIALLLIGRVPLFDSVTIAFGTAGTGGFAIKNDSLASYSPYAQWVTTVFMIVFSVNFNIYFLVLLRQIKKVLKDEELRWFLIIVIAAIAIVAANTFSLFDSLGETLRHSAFQVASIISTSGFCTVDFDKWPQISRTLLVLLMFIGACAGSTGGGSKVVRVVVLMKSARRALYKAFHPRAVKHIYLDGEILEEDTVESVASYYLIYFISLAAATMLVTVDGFSMETNFTAVVSCLNNVGPGMDAVGAVMNYGAYSAFSKLILSAVMLIGRLEIYPILVMIIPQVWKK